MGGCALLFLGVTVAILRGRSFSALSFSAYAIGAGGLNIAYIVNDALPLALTFAVLGFWGLFIYFPRRLSPRHAPATILAAATAFSMGVGYALTTGVALPATAWTLRVAAELTLQSLVSGGIIAVAFILPIRAGWTQVNGAEARSLGILAVGIVAASAGTFPDLGRVARGEVHALVGLLNVVYLLVPTILWLGVTRGPHARIARTVIIASVTIYLAALWPGPVMAWGVGQAGAALLLGYAVLRGQIDGLDIKVRFAISRSTIAAAFITAFFVASEGAQILFGRGNEWVGLFAAGALVFAIAPLQRAAERFAEKAVPVSSVSAPEANHLMAYRLAVEAALRDDGRLTSREETHLADLAQALGVGAGDALRMRREIETRATVDGRESR